MTANRLIADKAFDADQRVRRPLAVAGKLAVIPPRDHRRTVPDFDPELYRARHLIENFSCKLKQFRAIATRYDKTAKNFLAAIHLAAAIIWTPRITGFWPTIWAKAGGSIHDQGVEGWGYGLFAGSQWCQ
jgi:transposase